MDEHPPTETPREPLDTRFEGETPRVVEETSTEYLGRWNRLISTTNWEKGRIISEWREALIETEAPPSSYTDEAWARWVGNVTPQHAGRLRRVYQRFGTTREQYDGLYWSHFQAALDWDDAEMWLEGAVQNGWSISQMRHQRWQATGALEENKPRHEDVLVGELDEDVDPTYDGPLPEAISGSLSEVHETDALPAEASETDEVPVPAETVAVTSQQSVEPFRPFENLPTLPPDLNEAFEAFKLAILNHRISGWREVSCDDVLATLNSLKALALAPADA